MSEGDHRALMADALRELRRLRARVAELEANGAGGGAARHEPPAIVGLGCRLPGDCEDPASAWRFFAAGGDAVGPAPTDRWRAAAAPEPVPPGAFLREPFAFDAAFFRVPPREARLLDPQHRLLLEVAHATLEHAGIAPSALRGSDTGVFVGASTEDWAMQIARELPFAAIDGAIGPGANGCGAAGRIAFTFGLHGPTMTVNTACSSSLVALHLAKQALQRGECGLALVLGVNLMLSPLPFATFRRAGMLSPDGRCRTFGAGANGYGRGEGVVAVLLATPAAAARHRLTPLATLLGSAINQDGATAGLTVPSGPAQQRVLQAALRDAGVAAHDVQFVEAHGTGTMLGDPIEVQALAAVYGAGRSAEAPLWCASAKTNFGHLEAAAGLLGVLKTVLQLQHRTLAPHLHAAIRNPHLPWSRLPVRVPEQVVPWPVRAGERAIAGVSSFGFTGTNAHVVLAAPWADALAPGPVAPEPLAAPLPVPLCARTPEALRASCRRWADALAAGGHRLADVAATAVRGRSPDRVRCVVLAADVPALRAGLLRIADGEAGPGVWLGAVGRGEPPPVPAADAPLAERADAFVRGAAVSFESALPATARAVAMPTHGFQRRVFRLPTDSPDAPRVDAAAVRAACARAARACDREALLAAHVQATAAAVLQLAADDVDADAPLADLGFDSMRAVELANRLETDLGVAVSLAALAEGASPRELAGLLAAAWPVPPDGG